ncbi:MAG: ROK family protein [Gammaproteobacteria bacterium]
MVKIAAMGGRIGIDLGGSKIEGALVADDGAILRRLRIPTPKNNYDGIMQTVADIVRQLADDDNAPVGICTPGAQSPQTGMLKNSNTTCMNGKPVCDDLQKALSRPVRIANDANCLALSEAADGAAKGMAAVFAVIIGTGAGGGIAINGKTQNGANAVAGEWAHNTLPWLRADEYPGPECYCGRRGCCETFISGTGLQNDYAKNVKGETLPATEIAKRAEKGDMQCSAALDRYEDRLARGLAMVVNVLDPDIIVLGGGMSNVARLYKNLPELMRAYVFGGDFSTPVKPAKHGDSSGVRGAAWLWPVPPQQ